MDQQTSKPLTSEVLLTYNAKKVIYKRGVFFLITFLFVGYAASFITLDSFYYFARLASLAFLFLALVELVNALLFPLNFYMSYNEFLYRPRTQVKLIQPLFLIAIVLTIIIFVVLFYLIVGNPIRLLLGLIIAPFFLLALLIIPMIFFFIFRFYIKLYHQISAGYATVSLYFAREHESPVVTSVDVANELIQTDIIDQTKNYLTPTKSWLPLKTTMNLFRRLFFLIIVTFVLVALTYNIFTGN